MKVHTTEKTFQSSLCDNLFINEKELKIHKKTLKLVKNRFNAPRVTKHFYMKVNLIAIWLLTLVNTNIIAVTVKVIFENLKKVNSISQEMIFE